MSRESAIGRALRYYSSGAFKSDLARRIAIRSESQRQDRGAELERYLLEEMKPAFERIGFACELLTHDRARSPFLFAERLEGRGLPTVLGYGHGDVAHGLDDQWKIGTDPWEMREVDDHWYGRGVADNKGQHSINIASLASVLETRGALGFNAKYLIEMGEEVGSPGLRELCAEYKGKLEAGLLIASDGPRLSAARPTLFLGSRGAITFDLWINARASGQHSGNWGGLLSNPGIQLAHAISSLVGVTGQIRVPELVPPGIPEFVQSILADCELDAIEGGPAVEPWWGEPGLTLAERVFGWSSLEVLAYETGDPKAPVNAIPPRAWARLQLRYVVGVEQEAVLPAVRRHLDRHGFANVELESSGGELFLATRLDPEDPWVAWAAESISRTTSLTPTILPNIGGSLPNDAFSNILNMRCIWIPHSYLGCCQHAANEHLPVSIIRQGLAIMAGIYWDLGEKSTPGFKD